MGAPGCDDAPVISVPVMSTPQRDVTLIYPYYENPLFFEKQLLHWQTLPDDLKKHLRFIVVDDCSPGVSAATVACGRSQGLSLRVFRINVDVRWNWLAARNIGAKYAETRWLLITDMDHVVPTETLRVVLCGALGTSTIYRFSRVGSKTHPHPNSWLYTRDMYWQIGGYDEALSGHYGTDGEYRRRCALTAPIRILTSPLELHEYEGDSSTMHYKRKQPEDARAKQLIRARPRRGWRPKVLSFPYGEMSLL